jgi:mono/diheme cytochrome c family protein
MLSSSRHIASLAAALVLAAALNTAFFDEPVPDSPMLGNGDAAALRSVMDRWKTRHEQRGGAETLKVSLVHSPVLSAGRTQGRGELRLNLLTGALEVKARGLPTDGNYEVWLADNRGGLSRAVKPEEGDRLIGLGMLARTADGLAMLHTTLDRESLAGFELDQAIIARAGETPERGGILFGAPNLMQRAYFSAQPWSLTAADDEPRKSAGPALPFAFLLPKAAVAQTSAMDATSLEQLIARGRQIFVEETFDGNGRTCATCHRPDNNHTIDPRYIAKLPASDPLFVAEYNPDLKELEKPALLRQMGLILANVDGFDKPGVMRSVPHLLGLATSMEVEVCAERGGKGEFCEDEAYANALGWSGDGSPGTGSLREFALGAITQHMPKTLNRVPQVDFRLPTDEELTALEAYMLSLGRSEDIDLSKLSFNSPLVQQGKLLFDVKENPVRNGEVILGETANCNGCHQNAGATSSTTQANPTRDTGVERMRNPPAFLLDPSLAVDGGFGRNEQVSCGFSQDHTCYGTGRFNVPPLIEAADTAPFFHNNSVNTLEEAIASYNGDSFNLSPGAKTSSGKDRRVKLESSQVTAIALFLRTLNAIENIRSSNNLSRKSMDLRGKNAKETLKLAMADTEDAIDVLQGGMLLPYPEALARLEEALALEKKALHTEIGPMRNLRLHKAIALKLQAKALMVTEQP